MTPLSKPIVAEVIREVTIGPAPPGLHVVRTGLVGGAPWHEVLPAIALQVRVVDRLSRTAVDPNAPHHSVESHLVNGWKLDGAHVRTEAVYQTDGGMITRREEIDPAITVVEVLRGDDEEDFRRRVDGIVAGVLRRQPTQGDRS